MVTVWPVSSPQIAAEIIAQNKMNEGCDAAVDHYDLGTGQQALKEASRAVNAKLTGQGPFLLAWSPSSSKGTAGVPVLLIDLSRATTNPQFLNYFGKWRDSIQRNPKLWQSGGWSVTVEDFRLLFQEFVDANGSVILAFLSGGSK
jgi:hypothetical protein